jgi:hypothetical protein
MGTLSFFIQKLATLWQGQRKKFSIERERLVAARASPEIKTAQTNFYHG